jgi:YVTN family beta-propeller protein
VPARRSALLIATYRYEDATLRQLTAPARDAEALADTLRNPEIADFDVTILVNEPYHIVLQAIGEFYNNRRRDDLTLLYFTGHGLKDDRGRLYLAMTNTIHDRLLFTGLSAQQIDEAIESCSSHQKILVLDCCYSGAFPPGHISKAGSQVNTLEKFRGKGRVVLTASDSTQYSFEGNRIVGAGSQSVFTRFLVEGLTTGEADLDGDGEISIDELYSYVHDRVIEEMPQQRPKKLEDVEGRIVVAQNPHWVMPGYINDAIKSPFAEARLAALDRLAVLYHTGKGRVRTEVTNQVCLLTYDDSRMVSDAARKLIAELNPVIGRLTEKGRQDAERQQQQRTPNDQKTSYEKKASDKTYRVDTRRNIALWVDRQVRRILPALTHLYSAVPRRRNATIAVSALSLLVGITLLVVFLSIAGRTSGPNPSLSPTPSTEPTNGPEVAIPSIGPSIEVGKTPTFVAVSPNGGQAYIANRDAKVITMLDTATNRMTGTIPIPSGPPQHLAFTPDGRKAYVAVYNDEKTIHEIDVIDTASNSVIAAIPQPARPFVPAVTPDGKRLFVPEHDIGAVLVIDTTTNKVIKQIAVAPNPHWVAFSRDGGRAYTANHESNVISVIDTTMLTVLKTIPVGMSPHSIAVNPARPLVASVNYDANTVSEIDANILTVVNTIQVGKNPRDIRWAPDGRFAYVVNEGSNTVSVIDATTNQVTATVPTGENPTSIAVLPNSRGAYVSNLISGTLTVLQLAG